MNDSSSLDNEYIKVTHLPEERLHKEAVDSCLTFDEKDLYKSLTPNKPFIYWLDETVRKSLFDTH